MLCCVGKDKTDKKDMMKLESLRKEVVYLSLGDNINFQLQADSSWKI